MNTLQWRPTSLTLILLIAVCLSAGGLRPCAQADVYVAPTPQEQDYLAGLRIAGLHGDRSKIPEMIAALHKGQETFLETGLHALAQLGATEALPDFDRIIQEGQGYYLGAIATAAKARLLAEAAAGNQAVDAGHSVVTKKTNAADAQEQAATPQQMQEAQVKVSVFLQQIGLAPAQIVAAVKEHHRLKLQEQIGSSLEVCALGELADMAYQGSYAAYMTVPEFRALDFSVDPYAALKIKYAAVPKSQRARQLVEFMAKTGAQGGALQLAIDEGLPASRAAAAKLKEMDTHRRLYIVGNEEKPDYCPGFVSLFRLIGGVGTKEVLSTIEHFRNDKEDYISYWAEQAYREIKNNLRRQWVIGY